MSRRPLQGINAQRLTMAVAPVLTRATLLPFLLREVGLPNSTVGMPLQLVTAVTHPPVPQLVPVMRPGLIEKLTPQQPEPKILDPENVSARMIHKKFPQVWGVVFPVVGKNYPEKKAFVDLIKRHAMSGASYSHSKPYQRFQVPGFARPSSPVQIHLYRVSLNRAYQDADLADLLRKAYLAPQESQTLVYLKSILNAAGEPLFMPITAIYDDELPGFHVFHGVPEMRSELTALLHNRTSGAVGKFCEWLREQKFVQVVEK